MLTLFFLALAGLASAHPASLLDKRQSYVGTATFNDYSAQGNTNCGPKSGQSGTYGAAVADLSPDISGGKCSGSIDPSKCSGQSPAAGWMGPGCPTGNCGKCYTVTHTGGVGSSVSGVGNSITVQIIDACPATSPANFCKTDVPANQRCGDSGTNQLDIDTSAYMALTGQAFGSGPSLMIAISPSCCPGDPGCSASSASNADSKKGTQAVGAALKGVKKVEDDPEPCPEL